MTTTTQTQRPDWAEMLQRAVTEPGIVSDAYRRFHGYSLGNQILAMLQCAARGIPAGPLATYPRWKELGRQVRKGERAISLCMPITVKVRPTDDTDIEPESADVPPGVRTIFVFKNNWFVLGQTDGQDYTAPEVPGWNRTEALQALGITEEPFTHTDGNCQGYARSARKIIAINPVASMPDKTTFHEIAHCLLHGEPGSGLSEDGAATPRSLKEVEAESVAMLCMASLGLPGLDESRGYIQAWLDTASIPDRSAARIFKAADMILKAGQEVASCE